MPEPIKQILHHFIRERFMISRIHDLLKKNDQSHLVEVIGKPGSGKTYLIEPLTEILKENYDKIIRYSPHPLLDNHLEDVLLLITDLPSSELKELISNHDNKVQFGQKYD